MSKIFLFCALLGFSKLLFAQLNYTDSIKFKIESNIFYGNSKNASEILVLATLFPADKFLLQAKIFYASKHFQKATQSIFTLEKLHKKLPNYLLAQCYSQLNNPEKATYYLKLYLQNPKKKLISEIKMDTAFRPINETEQWQNLFKGDYYSKYELALNDANYNFILKKYELAYEIINKLITKKQKKEKTYILRAKIHLATKNLKAAKQDAKKALSIKPKNNNSKLLLAEILYEQKKYKKVEKLCRQIFVSGKIPDCKLFKLQAHNYFMLKKYVKAQNSIETYLTFYFKDIEATFLYAEILSAQSDFLTSLPLYGKCIAIEPKNPAFLQARGKAYLETKMYAYAEKDFLLALDYAPKDANIYYQKGFASVGQGNLQGAKSDWENAQKLGLYKAADAIEKYCKK